MNVDPNAWTELELIKIGLLALVYLFGLLWSVKEWIRARPGHFYWPACAILILGGTLGMILSASMASTGEMPPEFALSVWGMLAGLTGAIVRAVWNTASAALRRAHR